MARYIQRRNGDGKALTLYIPLVREYMNLTNEKDVKECIVKTGGCNTSSGVFLHPSKEGTQVNSSNSINRRSVSVIPESNIAPDLRDRFLLTRDILLNSNQFFCSAVFKPEEVQQEEEL